jgi:hypothetical protein
MGFDGKCEFPLPRAGEGEGNAARATLTREVVVERECFSSAWSRRELKPLAFEARVVL